MGKPTETPAEVNPLAALAESTEHEVTAAEVNVPQEIKDFVNAGHEFWQTKPKKWRSVVLANAGTVKDVTNKSRKFASATGRTFRVNKQATTDTRLVYKITDKPQAATEETPSE